MAWRMNQKFYVASGADIGLIFWWGANGDDKGAQWAMAYPVKGTLPCELATERVSKKIDYSIGKLTVNGAAQYGFDENSVYWTYGVDIHNYGPNGGLFQLEGIGG